MAQVGSEAAKGNRGVETTGTSTSEAQLSIASTRSIHVVPGEAEWGAPFAGGAEVEEDPSGEQTWAGRRTSSSAKAKRSLRIRTKVTTTSQEVASRLKHRCPFPSRLLSGGRLIFRHPKRGTHSSTKAPNVNRTMLEIERLLMLLRTFPRGSGLTLTHILT